MRVHSQLSSASSQQGAPGCECVCAHKRRRGVCAGWMRRALSVVVFFALAACGGTSSLPREEESVLVDHGAWRQQLDASGPFADVIGGECQAGGAVFEDPVFEINTDLCNGGTFTQPSLTPIFAGEVVHVVLWHLQLVAPAPAEAYIGVAVGDDVLYERTVSVPSVESVYKPYVAVDEDVPAGTPVTIHVHNHGENSYKFLEFEVGAKEAFPNYEPEEDEP